MERSRARCGWYAAWFLAACAVMVTQTGCINALAGMMYVFKGRFEEAEFDGLKGKKVAVVCRPMVQLRYASGNVGDEISRQLGSLLKQNVKRIEVIDQQRVSEWTDEHEWEDYKEIGEALGADLVVGLDLNQFELQKGQTLFQGTAQVSLKVYDIKNGGKVIYQKKMPPSVYPPNTGIATSEMQSEEFRMMFVHVLSDQIGRHFYPHDPRSDVAMDAKSL